MQPLIKQVFKTNGIKVILVNIFTLSFGWGLSTGDIAFTAFNADGDDDFAIVALADIPANTTIYFSDNEPNSDGTGFLDYNEGQLKWATGGSTISAGTIIVFTDTDNDGNTSFGASTGTLSDPFGRDPNLAADGDALYAVEGTDDGSAITVSAWLAGIQNESGNEGSNFDQTELTAGTTFINFYSSGSPDGGYYSGDRQGQSSFSGYLTHLGDDSKWTTETSNGENILPISTSAFSLGVTISGSSDHFRMMSSPVDDQIYSDLLSELWTQGMTGADVTSGDANVWTYSGTAWAALSDISGSGDGASLTAGQGFLVFVYVDTDNDGDTGDTGASGYLPVILTVSGTENSATVSISTTEDADDDGEGGGAGTGWNLLGNPFATTIDADELFTDNTKFKDVVYVYDHSGSSASSPDEDVSGGGIYRAWNSSAGSLTGGLIAPYQGFFVQTDTDWESGTNYQFQADAKSSSAGTFYKTMADNTGSISFTISSGNYTNQTFVSFMNNGEEGIDGSDAYKLLPMTPSERIVGISYAEGNGLDISNLPYVHEGSISIPLDIMYLTLDDDYNFVTNENDVNMSWDLSSLPETIIGLTLTDNTANATTDLLQSEELAFTIQAKGSFPAYGSGGVNIYPEVGESQFTLSVAYSALNTNDDMMPKEFALHQVYPNPFNPSTTISFDIPAQAHSNASLRIYDITGRLVTTLVDEQLAPGTHTLQWQPVNLSSGLYIVQLKAGDQTFNQKITFIK